MERIALVARAIIRARWGALVMTGVLAGLIGGLLLVSIAVARRTSTAWDRLAVATHAEDVRVTSALGSALGSEATEELAALPQISQSWVGDGLIGQVAGDPIRYLSVMAGPPRDPDLHHPILIEGRAADPDDPHELTVNEQFAERSGLGLGDEPTVDFLTYQQFLDFDKGFGEPAGPSVPFRIVGVTREPAPQGGLAPVEATPAFSREYVTPDLPIHFMRARLRHGAGDLPEFRREVAELGRVVEAAAVARDPETAEVTAFDVSVPREAAEPVAAAARVVVSGLLVAALVAALAGGTAVVQVLIRRHAADERNRSIESALGLTFVDQLRARVVTGTLAAGVAALTALAVAWGASAIGPLGSVGAYEPEPGAAPHLAVLTVGPLLVFALVLLLDTFAFRLVARPDRRRRVLTRRSPVVVLANGASPPVDVGVDLAFDRRRSRAAIAVRSARIGAVVGVAGVALTIVFAASLERLADTPARWGSQAAAAVVDTDDPTVEGLLADERVVSLAEVETNAVRVDGNEVPASAFTVRRGQIGWTMLDGRAPSSPDEVALGARYADELGLGVDDHLEVELTNGPGAATRRLTVVGVGLGPDTEQEDLGDGLLLTASGLADMKVREPYRDASLVVRPGSLDEFIADHGSDLEIVQPERPPEIANLADLGVLPLVLGAFLGVVAVAALANALVVAVQQRRRDLGTLRAMGMSRGEVREAICVAGVSIAAVGVVVGLPLGVVLGGSLWRFVASSVYVDGDPALTWPLLVVPVVALAVGALVSVLPGRRAALHPPAWMLRTD